MEKHTIKIKFNREQGIWIAIHSDPAITKLFNTDTLPTPFGFGVSHLYVVKKIQDKNPDSIVF